MKKNRLQEQADKYLSQYDNPAAKESILGECSASGERALKRTTRNWLIFLVVFLAVCVISLGSYFIFKKPAEKVYLQENKVGTKITIAELQNDLPTFNFKQDSLNSIVRFDDSLYKETLYYAVYFRDGLTDERLDVVIVTNNDYVYDFVHEAYDANTEVFNMNYVESITEEDGIYMFSCAGEFSVQEYKIYVQYEGMGLEPQSNFINFLQQCISANR